MAAIAVTAYMYFGMDRAAQGLQADKHDITQADNGKTVAFNKGDRFVLSLGEMDWTLSIEPEGIISRVKNIAVMRGAQGVYTADRPGTATIKAEGRPICAEGQMCAQYIVSFSANVTVK